MRMPGADEILVAARAALLDALEALEEQRSAIVLVGAQAVYLYTGDADVPIATQTKDSDIALDPELIDAEPLLEQVMERAGFHRSLGGQPGEWLNDDGIPVELLVPETLVPSAGRRGARMPPHSKHAARKVLGLEAALVDQREMTIAALDDDDNRRYAMRVAGPAALVVAKSHKLGERLDTPHRLVDKDAHDTYRLFRAVETQELVHGYEGVLRDERSAQVAQQSLRYLKVLFGRSDAVGSEMAGRVEEGIGDPQAVSASIATLSVDLLDALGAT